MYTKMHEIMYILLNLLYIRRSNECIILSGFYLAQKFREGNMGEVEVICRLGSPGGGVQEGDVPHPA